MRFQIRSEHEKATWMKPSSVTTSSFHVTAMKQIKTAMFKIAEAEVNRGIATGMGQVTQLN